MIQWRRLALLILPLFGAPVLSAQEQAFAYPVKFVCGDRPSSRGWDAVFAGRYYTAINLRNPSSDTLRLSTQIAATLAAPTEGPTTWGPVLTLHPAHALEVDCQEILALAQGARFQKGFFVIAAPVELDVVAVYSAGLATGVTTMDVEPIARRTVAACVDLMIARFERPTVSGGQTHVTLYVVNIGTQDAPSFDVTVEDPGRDTLPDRIQQATVAGLAAGAVVAVTVHFPYAMSGSNYMAALVGMVDPKNAIPECREDNNRRTLGAVP